MAVCPRCGSELPAEGTACPSCGAGAAANPTTTVYLPPDEAPPVPNAELEWLREATLGEFEIITEVGKGGMATVYLAHDLALNRKVALKVISTTMLVQPAVAERFKREARTAGALSHPNIIPIHAVRASEHLLFFVMKYVPGRSLDRVLLDGARLSLAMVGAVLGEAGTALDYAHRQGVIHRDVKPGNIMIDEEGFSLLTDFGIAKAAEMEGLTRTGTVVGTPTYLCPEVCQGQDVTPASDQYSFGVVAYELVAGRPPFRASSQVAMMYAQIHEQPRPITTFRPDCPPALEQAILRMLAKNPADRWPSMKEATQAIVAACPPVDEAVRAQIGEIARQRPERDLLLKWATPASPVPLTGAARRTPATSSQPQPIQPAEPVRPTRWPVWITGGVVLAGLVLVWRFGPIRPAAQVTPPSPGGDSLWLEARGAATLARQRAIGAGAAESDLAEGDSLRQLAESLALTGNKADAAVIITRATSAWSIVEASSRQAPQPAAGAPPAPARETTPPEAPPRAQTDSEIVAAFYQRLDGFINARQLADVKRLLPNLSDSESQRWTDLLRDRRTDSVRQSDIVRQVSRRGDLLYALLDRQLVVYREGKRDTRETQVNVTLSRGPEGWRQIQAETVK